MKWRQSLSQDEDLEKRLNENDPLLPKRKSSCPPPSSTRSYKKVTSFFSVIGMLTLLNVFFLSNTMFSVIPENGFFKNLAFNGPPAVMHDGKIIKGVVLDDNQEAWYGKCFFQRGERAGEAASSETSTTNLSSSLPTSPSLHQESDTLSLQSEISDGQLLNQSQRQVPPPQDSRISKKDLSVHNLVTPLVNQRTVCSSTFKDQGDIL